MQAYTCSTSSDEAVAGRGPSAAGLILLKLHAGGPKDAWDVRSLLETSEDEAALCAEVERGVATLGREASTLWARLRTAT